VIADEIHDIEKAREKFCRRMVVTLNGTSAAKDATALLTTLKAYRPGRTPVYIKVNKNGYSGGIALGEEWCVRPHSDLLTKLKAELEF
jgi:DNA polymerase III subunit alpha